jgi:hypothetical protein
MAAGYVPLMEFVSKGIEANHTDAPYRLTGPPPKRLRSPEATIDEKSQDSVLRQVGYLPQESVQNMQRAGRNTGVEQSERLRYQALREIGTESFCGEVEDQRSPAQS